MSAAARAKAGAAAVRPQASAPFHLVPARILGVTREGEHNFTLELDVSARPGGYSFEPGQFNMLYVYGVGEVPISVSGDPAETGVLVHTIRDTGFVTNALRKLGPGDVLGVRGPYGRPWPVDEAKGQDLLVVAGGLGLAPLRPVLYHVFKHRKDFGRVSLLYGARTPNDLLYRAELETWGKKHGIQTLCTVDQADPTWRGPVGVVTTLLRKADFQGDRGLVFICGPEIMMRFTMMDLEAMGVADTRMYVSLERNMKCGVGFCGHCQHGAAFVCKDGPVFRFDKVRDLFPRREI